MNIKILLRYTLFLVITCFMGCGKKTKTKNPENFYKLALLEAENGNEHAYKQAVYYLDLALERKFQERYLALKTALLLRLGGMGEAEKGFKKMLSGDVGPKKRAGTLNNYACLLAQKGKTQEAVNIWEKLERSKHYDTPEVALFNQGKLFIIKGDYQTAKNRLYKATLYAPRYVDAHYYLALIAGKYLKDYDLARREARIVLSLEPAHVEAKKLLELLVKSKD